MQWPRISIVTPSYMQGQYIERTIQSVLDQDYPNLEYIVMDGGSTDGTREILHRYAHRLTSWRSEPDSGQADAIARGLSQTTGQIMAYLNSDDLLAPGSLERVARYFQKYRSADAIYSHRLFIDEHDRITGSWILPRHNNHFIRRFDYIPQETCFWRRSLWQRAGNVDASFRFAMDYDLFMRFMRQGRMLRVNDFLGGFRVHSESKTQTQMLSVGVPEVKRIHATHGIRVSKLDRLWSKAMYLTYIKGVSELWSARVGVGKWSLRPRDIRFEELWNSPQPARDSLRQAA